MAAKFKTSVKRARFTVSGLRSSDMLVLGKEFLEKMKDRMKAARNIHDNSALPLTKKYAGNKSKARKKPIRDLVFTERLMRSMHVLRVDQNKAEIGFQDPVGHMRMRFNQRRDRQWGVSLSDANFIAEKIAERKRVRAAKLPATST